MNNENPSRELLSQLKSDFQKHREVVGNEKKRLLLFQLNWILILSTLALSFVVFLYVEKDPNLFIYISILCAVSSIFLSVSYTREMIDNADHNLNKGLSEHESILKNIELEFTTQHPSEHYSKWLSHMKENINMESKLLRPSYAGEVFNFLFILNITSGIYGFFFYEQLSFYLPELLVLVILILLSLMSALNDWSRSLFENISRILDKRLKKPIS